MKQERELSKIDDLPAPLIPINTASLSEEKFKLIS
jgi:hypothetical protein